MLSGLKSLKLLVAGLGFEPRMAKAYETSLVTGPFPRYLVETTGIEPVVP